MGSFLIFMVNPKQAILFIIVFLVLQQIEGNLIYPHVVGESVGLPSIWVLAAVTIGGNLMGIVGMLVFIPLLSVFYTIFREFVYLRLKKKHIKQVIAGHPQKTQHIVIQNICALPGSPFNISLDFSRIFKCDKDA